MLRSHDLLTDDAQSELQSKYAATTLEECERYHWFDLPDGRVLDGYWDLRNTWRDYLGNVDFKGLRVLDSDPPAGFSV